VKNVVKVRFLAADSDKLMLDPLRLVKLEKHVWVYKKLDFEGNVRAGRVYQA